MKKLSEYVDNIKFFFRICKEEIGAIKYLVAWVFLCIAYWTMNDIQLEFIPSDFYFFDKFIFIGTLIYLFFSEFKFLLNEHKKRVEYKILIVTYESFLTLFFKLIFATIFWTIVGSIIVFIWLLLGNKALLNNLKELLF